MRIVSEKQNVTKYYWLDECVGERGRVELSRIHTSLVISTKTLRKGDERGLKMWGDRGLLHVSRYKHLFGLSY